MKKAIFAGIYLCMAICGFCGGLWLSGYHTFDTIKMKPVKPMRHIPDTADFGAYLAGVLARDNQDVARAAEYYERAYLGDVENKALQVDLYLLSGLAGKTDRFIQTAKEISGRKKSYYAPLFLSADALGRGAYEEALSFIPRLFPQSEGIRFVLSRVLQAWSFAGLGEKDKAYKALKPLETGDLSHFYWYQRALLGLYFNQPDIVTEAFNQMALGDMPTVTALLVARHFYVSQNQWHADTPLYQTYQNTMKNNPALQEVLITRTEEFAETTPQMGVAEAFFMISTLVGGEDSGAETGLMFNQIAMLLVPHSDIYKIWSAEQFEAVKYYTEANRLYDSIKQQSATVLFKKALNLMLMNENEQAEQILTALFLKMPRDIMLAEMLGNLYRDTHRPALAADYYTKALALSDENDKKHTGGLYFSRAMAYEMMKNAVARDADLQTALTLMPDNAEVLNFLGYVWVEDGKNLDMAMDYIYRAHQLTPKKPHIWDSLAWGYYKQGNYKKALSYAEQAADAMPYSALVQSHLGDIYFALGRKREAGYQYHKALNLKADMTEALRSELIRKLSVR